MVLEASEEWHATQGAGPRGVPRHAAEGPGPGRPLVGSATVVQAGAHRVGPLAEEEGCTCAGHDQPDWALHAATRLREQVRQAHPRRPLVV